MRTRSMLGEQLEYPEYPKTDEYPEPPKVALRCPAQARKGPWVLPSTQRVSSDYPISTHRVPRVPKGGRAPRSIGASVLSARKGLRALPSTRRVHSKYPREYSEYPGECSQVRHERRQPLRVPLRARVLRRARHARHGTGPSRTPRGTLGTHGYAGYSHRVLY